MSSLSRRDFLRATLAAGTVASTLPLHASTSKATDLVTLGNSGLKVTRLAFGTGSHNGYVQSSLGQKEFTRLIHYAYDRGIRFFETSESYSTPAMLGETLRAFPRESYQLMTKVTTDEGVDPFKRFDEMRRIAQAEYFDIMPALRRMPGNKWLEVAMIRMNHNGTRMDGPDYRKDINPDNRDEVVEHVKQVKREGMGVISMKLIGDTVFVRHEDRVAAMRFAFKNSGIDCATVGFKNTQEIDEAIDNMNLALS